MKQFLFCCGIVLLQVSCTTRPVSPSKASRRAIDTVFQQKVIALQPTIDSLCTHIKDSVYKVAVDSILNERMTDMNELVE
ncbi:MAG: hypothetical protein SH808_08035 [Saprospiraceae bacterium]|nr:hypothetical protein [Saprospiraceae bacterium]